MQCLNCIDQSRSATLIWYKEKSCDVKGRCKKIRKKQKKKSRHKRAEKQRRAEDKEKHMMVKLNVVMMEMRKHNKKDVLPGKV